MARDNIRTLQESDGKYSLFFPSAVMAGIGWKKQDKIRIDIAGANQLRLSKVEKVGEAKENG